VEKLTALLRLRGIEGWCLAAVDFLGGGNAAPTAAVLGCGEEWTRERKSSR
jgi:hypothetical protein